MHKIILFQLTVVSIVFAFGEDSGYNSVDEQFYDNGNIKHQRTYKDGFANGKWVHFYKNGNVWVESNYQNGIKTGTWITYYESGKEWTNGNYINNKRSGEWIFYNKDGTVFEKKKY